MKKMFLLAVMLMFVVSFTSCKDKKVVVEEETIDTTAVQSVDSVETTIIKTVEVNTLTTK